MIQSNLILLKDYSYKTKIFSAWCCKNGNPAKMKVITTTFIRWEETGQTQLVPAGYASCGFGGWSKCTIFEIQHV